MCFGAAVGKFNKGSIILMNGGAGSNHYRDLTWYENFYFTPLLVDECLSECYDSCPGVVKNFPECSTILFPMTGKIFMMHNFQILKCF